MKKQLMKELGLVLAFSAVLVVLLALAALVVGLVGTGGVLDIWWRLCSFAGGIVLLAAAVLLLTKRADSKKMELWEKRFPHLSFTWTVLLVGILLLLTAGAVNYLIS